MEFQFDQSDLVAGALALDFANTMGGDREAATSERLGGCLDLVAWSRVAGIVDADEERRLRAAARRDSTAAAGTYRRAIELREAIYAAFVAIVRRKPPPRKAVGTITDVLAARLPTAALQPMDGRFVWAFPQGKELDGILGPIAASAFDLLATAMPERLRQCDGDTCGWLFYDTSKTGRRRWCDMRRGCGNRAKARRYRERHRANIT